MIFLALLLFTGVGSAGVYAGRQSDKVVLRTWDVCLPANSHAVRSTRKERRADRALEGGVQPLNKYQRRVL